MKIKRPISSQPIPRHAKRVFNGVMFDVYHWDQKLYDGSTTTFEKIKKTDTVNIIPITNDGKIILSEQEQPGTTPFIGVLGGVVDRNETPRNAAKRELLEEAGYKADEFILWDASQFIDKIDWAIYTFIAKGVKKVQEPQMDPGEKIKIKFASFNEYLKIITQDNYRDKELALTLLRIAQDPVKLARTRKLFEA